MKMSPASVVLISPEAMLAKVESMPPVDRFKHLYMVTLDIQTLGATDLKIGMHTY